MSAPSNRRVEQGRTILEVELKGALLVGAGSSAGFDDASIRRPEGEPYLPASALKGALREQLVRLTDEATAAEIFGAAGPDLGRPGDETQGGSDSRVLLADGELSPQVARRFRQGDGYASRIQVSLDRRARRARDHHLFHREIVAPFGEGLVFRASVDLTGLDEQGKRYFQAAAHAVFAIGGGRSGGLGGVAMRLVLAAPTDTTEPGDRPSADKITLPETERIELVFKALDPLNVGIERVVGNFRTTHGRIPATTLRGAVVTAALRHRGERRDLRQDPDFRRLLLEDETCLRFGDAVPVAGMASNLPEVAPLTFRVCKTDGARHGGEDALVASFVRLELARHGHRPVLEESCRAPGCAQRLVPTSERLGGHAPARRVVTRLAIDSASARSKDGALFSMELLERGTHFGVCLDRVGAEARKLLEDASRGGIRVGNGRGQGYGRVRLVAARQAPYSDLKSRIGAFDSALRQYLSQTAQQLHMAPAKLGAEDHYLVATLLSDLACAKEGGGQGAEQAFFDALGLGGAELVYGQVRTGLRGGFSSIEGGPKASSPIVSAGSVLLLRFTGPLDDALIETLARYESGGIGQRRDEGLGWIRFSDGLHLPGWKTFPSEETEQNMIAEATDWLGRLKPTLVEQAESFVEEKATFEPRPGEEHKKAGAKKPNVTNSQLRNLLNVIETEGSVKVLRNFLRYQIGREKRGWPHADSAQRLIEILDSGWTDDALPEGADRRALEAEAAALFLGYVIREHTYRCRCEGTSTNA